MISFSKRIFGVLDGNGNLIKKGDWIEIDEEYNKLAKGSLIEILEEKK